MDTVTLISHTDGTKSVRYGIDYVVDTLGIEQYTYKSVTPESIEKIRTVTIDKLQALLNKLF